MASGRFWGGCDEVENGMMKGREEKRRSERSGEEGLI